MNYLMVDLETLGTSNDAVISHIGAVVFRLDGIIGYNDGDTFYRALDIIEQQENGRIIESGTVKWWMQQSDEARKAFEEESEIISIVLPELRDFCKSHKIQTIWGNGNTFDNMILRNIFKQSKHFKYPVSFRDDMDLRTAKLLTKLKEPGYQFQYLEDRVAHNALDDAKSQVYTLQRMWKDVLSK